MVEKHLFIFTACKLIMKKKTEFKFVRFSWIFFPSMMNPISGIEDQSGSQVGCNVLLVS